jgi:release factor glutamine methyltransferase
MRNSVKLIQESNIVISNPPYLSSNHHRKLQKQVRMYEAHEALVGGEDGLEYIRYLVAEIIKQKAVR